MVISGFRREVDDICALLGYYAACSGNYRLFGTSSRSHLQGWIDCTETSVRNYHYTLGNTPEERRSRRL
jgi:hypothetical protein